MLGEWSYVALADGVVTGAGWNYELKKGVCGGECGEKLIITLA
jgi:hypothetical protein